MRNWRTLYAFLFFNDCASLFSRFLQSHFEADSESRSTLIVSRTEFRNDSRATPSHANTNPHPRPKPRPIFSRKRKISEETSGSGSSSQKRTRSDNFLERSIAAPVNDIRQALTAQHEPQPAAVNGLRMCSLASCGSAASPIISPYSIISDTIPVVSQQTVEDAYLSQTCH
jgi:hypothetical protein